MSHRAVNARRGAWRCAPSALVAVVVVACGAQPRDASSTGASSRCAGAPPPASPAVPPPRQVLQTMHSGRVLGIAPSSDGRMLTTSEDGTARVWDVTSRALLHVVPTPQIGMGATFVQGDRWALTVDQGDVAETYAIDASAADGAPRKLDVERSPGALVRFEGADGVRIAALATGGYDTVVLDEQLKPIRKERVGGQLACRELASSADGTHAVCLEGQRWLDGASLTAGAADLPFTELPAYVHTVAVSPKGDHIAVIMGADGAPGLYVAPWGGAFERIDSPASGERPATRPLAFSSDGTQIASGRGDAIVVYDVATKRARWRAPGDSISPLPAGGFAIADPAARSLAAFDHDGRRGRPFATAGGSVDFRSGVGSGMLFDGQRLLTYSESLAGRTLATSFVGWSLGEARSTRAAVTRPLGDANGALTKICPRAIVTTHAATMTRDGRVVAFNCETGDGACSSGAWLWSRGASDDLPVKRVCLGERSQLFGVVRGLAIVTSRTTDSGPQPREMSGIDIRTGEVMALGSVPFEDDNLHDSNWAYQAMRASSNGRWLVGRYGHIWDLDNRRFVTRVAMPSEAPVSIASQISDDGQRVAFQRDVGAITEVDVATGKEISLPVEHAFKWGYIGGTRDLVVGTLAGVLERYSGGRRVAQTAPLGAAIEQIEAVPAQRLVATYALDGAMRIFDLDTFELRATVASFDDGEDVAYTPRGAYTGTREGASRIAWVFDQPRETFGFEQLAASFMRPDLVRRRVAGEHVDVDAQITRPPRVVLTSDPTTGSDRARVHVHATSSDRVDDVHLFVEGRPVADVAVCSADGVADVDVPLVHGGNIVSAVAGDAHGVASNVESLAVTSTAVSAKKPDLYVVSVGVNEYPALPRDEWLAYAAADARAISAAFSDPTRTHADYAMVHTTTLTDADVTVDSVLRALDDVAKMHPEDLAVVFFAGHGVKPTRDEDMVFLTSHAAANVASIRANGIGWGQIASRLDVSRGRVLMLLDACHSGHISQEQLVHNEALAASLARGGRAGAIVFAASKGRQYSYEPGGGARALALDAESRAALPVLGDGAHGLFTAAVLASLDAVATDTNGNGSIELSELVADVGLRVSSVTAGRQTPWVARQESFGDFRIAPASSPGQK